jgi:hypothetical protein
MPTNLLFITPQPRIQIKGKRKKRAFSLSIVPAAKSAGPAILEALLLEVLEAILGTPFLEVPFLRCHFWRRHFWRCHFWRCHFWTPFLDAPFLEAEFPEAPFLEEENHTIYRTPTQEPLSNGLRLPTSVALSPRLRLNYLPSKSLEPQIVRTQLRSGETSLSRRTHTSILPKRCSFRESRRLQHLEQKRYTLTGLNTA